MLRSRGGIAVSNCNNPDGRLDDFLSTDQYGEVRDDLGSLEFLKAFKRMADQLELDRYVLFTCCLSRERYRAAELHVQYMDGTSVSAVARYLLNILKADSVRRIPDISEWWMSKWMDGITFLDHRPSLGIRRCLPPRARSRL